MTGQGSNAPAPPVKDLPELTASRILAALCVVICHLHGLGFVSAPLLHDVLDGGRPAVSFFFILSGFIMNHNYPSLRWNDAPATRRYVRSRLARLYPTVVFALLIALPTGMYLLESGNRLRLLELYALQDHYSFWLSFSALAQVTCATGWLPVAALNQPWNSPAWSLSCEFFFYALFPLLRPALEKMSVQSLLLTSVAGIALQAVWIVAIQALLPLNRSGFIVAQFPLTHLPEFVLGIATGLLIGRLDTKASVRLILALTAASLALHGLVREATAAFPRFYALLPAFAAAIAAIAMASGSPYLSILRAAILVRLGHASYALYMLHVPILMAAIAAGIGSRLGWLWLVPLLAASYAVHFYFAEPIRRIIIRRPNRPPTSE